MKVTRGIAVVAGAALAASLWTGSVSAQSESASAEDGKPASEAPAETAPAPNVPLGANLTPPLGALPPGPVTIGSGQPGSSSVSMAPGTLTAGVAREGVNAVRAPETEPAPAPVEAAPEPVADTVPAETSEPVAADTAVATETDLDGDNYPDELEWDLGLDPNNVDTDADGVADGDELNIYGTEPTLADTDGDGGTDGGELFDTRTDPLVWNDFSTEASSQSVAQEAAPAPVQSVEPLSEKEMVALGQESSEDLSATNGDAAALGTGNASAAPGNVTRGGVPVSGAALLGPDGKYSVNEISPPNVSVSGTTSTPPVIEPAPGTEAAPEPVVETVETSEPVAADTTVASAEDADADNYADAAELEIGLDPSNSDTDGDGVADGDEATIYFTDPFTRDSDGDSLSDGEELFSLLTDPLVYDANGVSDGEELPV
jgi:hypothetical protein